MVILHDKKLIFVSVPKSGTHTFFRLLTEKFGGERIERPYHKRNVPPELTVQGYKVFSACRNPYDRAVSVWYHVTQRDPYKDLWRRELRGSDIDTVLRYCIEHREKSFPAIRGQVVMYNQWEWLKPVPVDFMVHLESMAEDMTAIGLPMSKDDELNEFHASYKEPVVLTVAQKKMVQEWAREDFEEFGYAH